MTARRRLVSPQFFTHAALFDAEETSGLPLRLAFAGLWTACDRRGIFEWKPRVLKLQVLPYDTVDFDAILDALRCAGFVEYYVVDGKQFGRIPSFERWQTFHKNEKPSDAPNPPSGVIESSIGGPESSNGRRSTPVVIAVAGTASSAVAGSVAGASDAPPAPSASESTGNSTPSTPPRSDVDEFLAAHDFGPFATLIDGLCRSARHPAAVLATLRMHLAGEMSHELATPLELGLAVQQFVANGKEFNAMLFAGYVRGAKKGADRTENRRRNAREERATVGEVQARADEAAEQAEADALLEEFARCHPERYKAIAMAENRAVPASITFGREEIVRGRVLAAIRREPPQAGAA